MATDDWAPAACTLPTPQRPLRLAEFEVLFASVQRVSRPNPTQLHLTLPRGAEDAARDLAERESACCSFFSFGFEPDGAEVVMSISVPLQYIDVLDVIEARVIHRDGN
jgi:hypothetical protein